MMDLWSEIYEGTQHFSASLGFDLRVTTEDISQQCHNNIDGLKAGEWAQQIIWIRSIKSQQAYLEMEMSDTTVNSYRAAYGT